MSGSQQRTFSWHTSCALSQTGPVLASSGTCLAYFSATPLSTLHYTSPLTTPLSFSLSSPLVSPSSAPSPPAAMCQIFVAPQARPHSVPASDFAFASLCYFFRILFAVFFLLLPTCLSFSWSAHLHEPRSCRRPPPQRLSRPKYLHLPALFVPMKWKYVNKRRKLAPAIKHTQTHRHIHTYTHQYTLPCRPSQARLSARAHYTYAP